MIRPGSSARFFMEKRMRLQKYLADAGIASRRACEKLIEEGRVSVNGVTASIGMSVEEGDRVLFDGRPVKRAERLVYIMLYKPRGVVSTSDDPQGRKTVQSYFTEVPERVYNVGRLDLNSEGLLLMTNDGELMHRLTHPSFGAEKTYYTVFDGKVTATEIASLVNGVMLDDGMTAPAKVDFVRPTERGDTSFLITIHEGRNRQVRRMAEAVGHRCLRLKRERFAGLSIAGMKPGEWRFLTDQEVSRLRSLAKLDQK